MGDPGARLRRLAGELRRELRRLDRVRAEAAAALKIPALSPLELRGAAGVLHDWCSGLEKAFSRVALTVDGGLPEGPRWHRRLLESMTVPLRSLRPAVLTEATAARLDPYLRFRHLFRAQYGFDLEFPRLRPLLEGLDPLHAQVTAELEIWAAAMETLLP